jgi:hypothetical protein
MESGQRPVLFVERSSDGIGNSFDGRVDVGDRNLFEIWEIKPNTFYGWATATAEASTYAASNKGPNQYSLGGVDLAMPPRLDGKLGTYTYLNAGAGAIYWDTPSSSRSLNSAFYRALQNQWGSGAAFMPLPGRFALP